MKEITHVERPVLAWAADNGFVPMKLTLYGNGGWPDTLYLFTAPFLAFIEFKQPGAKPRLRQLLRIEELRRRGYAAAVFDNPKEAIAWLRQQVSIQLPGVGCPAPTKSGP